MKVKSKLYSDGNDNRNPEKIASTSKRLKEAMVLRNKKQKDLVDITKTDKGSISHYLSGRYEPKKEAVNKLASALNVSEMWLWGYDVPMERSARPFGEEENPYALDVSDTLDTLEADDQKYVRDWVNDFAKNPEEMKKSPSEPQLTEGEKKMLELFRKIPVDKQPAALDMLQAALEMQKKL